MVGPICQHGQTDANLIGFAAKLRTQEGQAGRQATSQPGKDNSLFTDRFWACGFRSGRRGPGSPAILSR